MLDWFVMVVLISRGGGGYGGWGWSMFCDGGMSCWGMGFVGWGV